MTSFVFPAFLLSLSEDECWLVPAIWVVSHGFFFQTWNPLRFWVRSGEIRARPWGIGNVDWGDSVLVGSPRPRGS